MVGQRYSVDLPLPPADLSPRKRGRHWAVTRKAADAYKSDCLAILRSLRLDPARRVTLHWTLMTARLRNSKGRVVPDGLYRPRDKDNAIAALKYAQDAIVAAGVVVDDDAKRVQIGDPEILGERESRGKRCARLVIEVVE